MRTLLFSDFDDTLYVHGDKEQTKQNLEAVRAFRERGGLFGLATGRGLAMLEHTMPEILKEIDILVDLDGALTYAVTDGELELMRALKLPERDIVDINKVLRRRVPRRWRDIIYYQGEREMRRYRSGPLAGIQVWCTNDEDCRSMHRILSSHGHSVRSWYNILPEMNFSLGRIKWVHDDVRHLLYIAPRDVTKAIAIKAFAPMLVDDTRIITVGDDINDLDMLSRFEGYAINPSPALENLLPKTVPVCQSLAEVIKKVSP